MRFIRMSERLIIPDSVFILPADLFPLDEAAGLQVGNDPLHGPLGDSNPHGHLSQHQGRAARQEQQHMRVIRQKSPLGPSRFRRW